MRGVGQGAAWFRSGFSQTPEGLRSVSDADGTERLKYEESFTAASRYAVMMEGLTRVLLDKDGKGASPEDFGLSAAERRLEPRSISPTRLSRYCATWA